MHKQMMEQLENIGKTLQELKEGLIKKGGTISIKISLQTFILFIYHTP